VGLLAVALIGLNGALAQDNNKNKRDYPTLLDTSDVKGAKVKNLQNEDIGAILTSFSLRKILLVRGCVA
jgi:hypothetical protein